VDSRNADIDLLYDSMLSVSGSLVDTFLQTLSICQVEYSYRVLERSADVLPVIADDSVAALMKVVANLAI